MDSVEEIVERIDGLLIQKNLKRQALYDAVGIAKNSLSNWKERGTMPAADKAIKMAQYLGVSVEWLVTGKDPEGLSADERELLRNWRDAGAGARTAAMDALRCDAERNRAAQKNVSA